jgi:hypothetical protein
VLNLTPHASIARLPEPVAGGSGRRHWLLGDGALALIEADRPLSVFDGRCEQAAIELPVRFRDRLDRFADGRWLIVAARTADRRANAQVRSANGALVSEFWIGDGIEHVRCAPDGSIWAGYFDEGVFSLDRDADGNPSPSGAGVARFGAEGAVLWRYPVVGDPPRIDDCYAMTLDGPTVWVCAYSSFALTRIQDGAVRSWASPFTGVTALAIDGEHAVLAGGYDGERDRIALVRLARSEVEVIGEARFDLVGADLIQGRGDILHVVREGAWARIDVAAVRRALGR